MAHDSSQASTPLRVASLRLQGFRNLEALSLEPGPRFNVVYGANGEGKSNLLEALDYIATLRSFRRARTDDLICDKAQSAELVAQLIGGPAPRTHRVELARNRARRVSVDGKRPRSAAAYYSTLQVVLFHPGDLQLVAGGPDERRAYLDRLLQQFDVAYGSTLASYQKALRSRNRLLRADRPDRKAIAAYDELLASSGAVLASTRASLLEQLGPRIERVFRDISGDEVQLSVRYEPRVAPEVDRMRAALRSSLDRDLARGFTAEGPHADDLGLRLGSTAARHYGSQGQHRAIVLALKVGELFELERRVERVPILLLDDVSSELDRTRNRRLFELLSELGGQVFLSTTHPEFILLDTERIDFEVRSGTITRVAG